MDFKSDDPLLFKARTVPARVVMAAAPIFIQYRGLKFLRPQWKKHKAIENKRDNNQIQHAANQEHAQREEQKHVLMAGKVWRETATQY